MTAYGAGIYGAGPYGASTAMLPAYASAAYLVRPRIYHAGRENLVTHEITEMVTSLAVDWDIDRQGAKGHLRIAAMTGVDLPARSWIAPFLEITPEIGDATTTQMGLYELDEPTVRHDARGQATAEATGQDIVRLLERAIMTEPQVTPHSTNVMDEVRRAIMIATGNGFGPNLLLNPGFESGLTNWAYSTTNDMTGTILVQTGGAAVGAKCAILSSTSVPSPPEEIIVYQEVPCPPDLVGRLVWYSGWAWVQDAAQGTILQLNCFNDAYTVLATGATETQTHPGNWHNHFAWVRVPEGTTKLTIYGRTRHTTGAALASAWDGFELRRMNGVPLQRLLLPYEPRTTGSNEIVNRIVHPAGTRWLTRINDLLAAIGYHALSATNDGRPTARPLRDRGQDTPTRTYTLYNDARIVGPVTTERSRTNIYNVVTVVKENAQDGTALVAVARNDDPAHPWSTVNMGEIGPPQPVTANNATDELVLVLLAEAALRRASMSEAVTLSVLPDPALAMHDTIEVIADGNPASGRWAIEQLRFGMTANDPLVEISARRIVTYEEATG